MKKHHQRIYIRNLESIKCNGPCLHGTDKNSRYYLDAEYASKYNHCMFCAIETFNGPMPHKEIALCLGINRMTICQIEKKVSKILSKRIELPYRAYKLVDDSFVKIQGLVKNENYFSIKSSILKIANDFSIQNPIFVSFLPKNITFNFKTGKAIYEYDSEHKNHFITLDSRIINSKSDFIRTIIHELFHAVQIENKKDLSEEICEIVEKECFGKYYKSFLSQFKKNKTKIRKGIINSDGKY